MLPKLSPGQRVAILYPPMCQGTIIQEMGALGSHDVYQVLLDNGSVQALGRTSLLTLHRSEDPNTLFKTLL